MSPSKSPPTEPAAVSETAQFIEFTKQLGAQGVTTEDDCIAYCLHRPEEEIWMLGFARLYDKYYAIVRRYVDGRCGELSVTARDMIADFTFDRIKDYRADRRIRTSNGSLGGFVALVCQWAVKRVFRKETRRHHLLAANFQDLWCVQRDQADAFRGDTVSGQDVADLLAAIQMSLNSVMYPNTAHVFRALSAIFINTNGLQVEGRPRNPGVASIKDYLDRHGHPMGEEEIVRCLNVLRARASSVLEEYGWLMCSVQTYAQ